VLVRVHADRHGRRLRDGRSLRWFDQTDRLPDPAVRKLEPEVEGVLLARAAAQRDAAEATLRGALARTGMRKPEVTPDGSAAGPRTARPPAKPRKSSAVP
jgi:hypothetical protein